MTPPEMQRKAIFAHMATIMETCDPKVAREALAECGLGALPMWQPIETAPKDRAQYILVTAGRGVWIAHWDPIATSGYRFDQPWRSVMLNHDHIAPTARCLPPTHWMPLPPPPTAGVEVAPAPGIYEQRLRAVLDVIQRYLPPDGIDMDTAMGEIIGLVDPWPDGVQAALASNPEASYSGWLWTHNVRGGEYRMVGTAHLQTDRPLRDLAEVVVYRAADGRLWVRAADEWDTRFKRIRPDPEFKGQATDGVNGPLEENDRG